MEIQEGGGSLVSFEQGRRCNIPGIPYHERQETIPSTVELPCHTCSVAGKKTKKENGQDIGLWQEGQSPVSTGPTVTAHG